MSWHLKVIPLIGPLLAALRAKNWLLSVKYIATILTIIFLGTGLVVLSGCGTMAYNSAGQVMSQPTPSANQQVIERVLPPSSNSEILAPK